MILVIDNYDSFTYNLVQLVRSAGVDVEVGRNDRMTAAQALESGASGLILSPGPGRPEDAGICLEIVASHSPIPILGVCLGHQVIGQAFGARIGRAPRLMHGKTSEIRHLGVGPFVGIESPFVATRYHSLEVRAEGLPEVLEPLAWSEEETLQGMRHRELPYCGSSVPSRVDPHRGGAADRRQLSRPVCGEPVGRR